MKSYATVDEFILNSCKGKELLMVLREILNSTELHETVKWGAPCYTINGKNVIGLGAFKAYVAMWFFQGALLKDSDGVLINAQENKTKALRQWRFESANDLNEKQIRTYVNEAIENQKQNKVIKVDRNKPLAIPTELNQALKNDKDLETAFDAFPKGKQREFAEHISSAKQEKTKYARLEKIILMIKQDVGLNDKYRNC